MKITIGAVVKGGTSTAYKTGSWRDARPVIDWTHCSNCGTCYEVCPEPSVYQNGGRYAFDYDYCKGCGLCAYECPTGCIQMVPEDK
jgi:pyruvate ferredoxin oxidoreductase delta subunit